MKVWGIMCTGIGDLVIIITQAMLILEWVNTEQ